MGKSRTLISSSRADPLCLSSFHAAVSTRAPLYRTAYLTLHLMLNHRKTPRWIICNEKPYLSAAWDYMMISVIHSDILAYVIDSGPNYSYAYLFYSVDTRILYTGIYAYVYMVMCCQILCLSSASFWLFLGLLFSLKMKAVCCSETSLNFYQTTWSLHPRRHHFSQ